MRGPRELLQSEDHWVTSMGAWFPEGRVVFRGKDLHNDLKLSWMGLYLYAITGRLFSDEQLRLFDGIWKITHSYPDPRIWNNRIAALAGTARSTAQLGIGAATAASEAIIYGTRVFIVAADFLSNAKASVDQGNNLEDFLTAELRKVESSARGKLGLGKDGDVIPLPGYGRPLVRADERIAPLMELAKETNCADGPLVALAFEIEETLKRQGHNLSIHATALMCALVLDQGLTPRQMYYYTNGCFIIGFSACAIDAFDHPEGTLFPLRCERIRYDGKAHRTWNSD